MLEDVMEKKQPKIIIQLEENQKLYERMAAVVFKIITEELAGKEDGEHE